MAPDTECAVARAGKMIMVILDHRDGREPALVKSLSDSIVLVGKDGLEETLLLNGEQGQKDLQDLQDSVKLEDLLVCEMDPLDESRSPRHWLAERAR